MKKVYYSLMALSLITASCSDNNSVINEEIGLNAISSVNATLENADTRAYFTSETTLAWEIYDNITVFSDTKKKPTTFFKAEKEDKVVFYGNEVKGNTFYAIYPQVNNNNNGYIDPAVKGLVHVMFDPWDNSGDGTKPGNNNIYMAAKSTNNDFTFKQTYGVIRLGLTGNMQVNDINLMSNNQEKISGEAIIDLTADEPVLVIDSQSQYAYTYKGVSVYETMNPGTTHYVYFKLPPTNFTKGFTVSIHCQNPDTGEGYSINKTTTTPVEIKRGKIKAYKAINVDPLTLTTGNNDFIEENVEW